MFLASLVLLAQTAPPQDTIGKTVVVTARSLKDTERDLAACLARRCSPKEDIAATLAHAENLFISGDFATARTTLSRSRDRNLRHARELPIEVSDLTRAYARMLSFDGYAAVARISQIDSLEALKKGLDRDDARVLAQRMLVGDEFLRAGRLTAADEVYRTVEKQARKAKLYPMQGHAMLRQATVFSAIANVRPAYRQAAREKVARLQQTTEPELAEHRDAVALLKARLAGLDGDERAIDAAIADLARQRHPQPILIYSPVIELVNAPTAISSTVGQTGSATPKWIDVAFDIASDGRVREIDVLRQSSSVDGDWPKRVQQALLKRRYTPPADGKPVQRIERFALVENVVPVKGTRMPGRSHIGRIVSLDLTVEPPAS